MTLIYISLEALKDTAQHRPPGYYDEIVSAAVHRHENRIALTEADYERFKARYGRPGPGAELKKLLKTIGIEAKPNCSCNKRAQLMDHNEATEPGWCEAHIEEISGWLQEEAHKRGLPYIASAGKLLIRMAIKRAKRGNGSV
jgi:hypothetical protein